MSDYSAAKVRFVTVRTSQSSRQPTTHEAPEGWRIVDVLPGRDHYVVLVMVPE